jgi:hypothetical protein
MTIEFMISRRYLKIPNEPKLMVKILRSFEITSDIENSVLYKDFDNDEFDFMINKILYEIVAEWCMEYEDKWEWDLNSLVIREFKYLAYPRGYNNLINME